MTSARGEVLLLAPANLQIVRTSLAVLLRPRYLILTLMTAVIVVTCVFLGRWQLRRLDERRAVIQRYEQSQAMPLEDLSNLLDSGASADSIMFRPVRATGVYLPEEEVAIIHRTRFERAGSDLVTPLRLDDGRVVLVRRGWVPVEQAIPPVAEALPPAGRVTVTGLLVGSEPRSLLTPDLPPEGVLRQMPRLDISRIAHQIEGEVASVAILAERTEPPGGELPIPIELGGLDEGPHRSYAVQWFLFALIASITYGALLRRGLRSEVRPA